MPNHIISWTPEYFNTDVEEVLVKLFQGQTIKEIAAPSLCMDGSGPRALIIRCGDNILNVIVDEILIDHEKVTYRWNKK